MVLPLLFLPTLWEEISITVERNPEKTNELPPLGDDVVQLGDFYNFQVDGNLTGPVDLVLPFDEGQIPDKDGVLVVGVPSDEGWKFVPAIPDGNVVTLYTTSVGDPLIAWHFVDVEDRIDLSYEIKDDEEPLTVCDARIPVQVTPSENGFKINGQVRPIDTRYENILGWVTPYDLKPAANIEVTLELNLHGWRDASSGKTFTVITDEQGVFEYIIDQADVGEGWNWIFAKAQCDKWWGKSM